MIDFFRKLHNDEKFECTECNKEYNSKENLALHQKTTGHSGERSTIECEESSKDEESEIMEADDAEEKKDTNSDDVSKEDNDAVILS